MGSEWALVFFTAFVGLGSGTFIAVCASEYWHESQQVRWHGSAWALAALAVGGFSSVLHLGHPERIFGALGHPTSGIFTEAMLIGLTGLCVIAYMVSLRRSAVALVRKGIAALGATLAALLAFSVGYTYLMPSRPAWNTLVVPLLFLVSALVLGSFSLIAVVTRTVVPPVSTITSLRTSALCALAAQAVLTVAYLVHLVRAPFPDVDRSIARILVGGLAPLFWIGVLLIGFVFPLALLTRRLKNVSSPMRETLCVCCSLVGTMAFRVMMFHLGTSVWHFF